MATNNLVELFVPIKVENEKAPSTLLTLERNATSKEQAEQTTRHISEKEEVLVEIQSLSDKLEHLKSKLMKGFTEANTSTTPALVEDDTQNDFLCGYKFTYPNTVAVKDEPLSILQEDRGHKKTPIIIEDDEDLQIPAKAVKAEKEPGFFEKETKKENIDAKTLTDFQIGDKVGPVAVVWQIKKDFLSGPEVEQILSQDIAFNLISTGPPVLPKGGMVFVIDLKSTSKPKDILCDEYGSWGVPSGPHKTPKENPRLMVTYYYHPQTS